jgi:2-polyprenyl-3-methyl-5-hydroxy-6-metoxy-1,4-benzoquinol methylase
MLRRSRRPIDPGHPGLHGRRRFELLTSGHAILVANHTHQPEMIRRLWSLARSARRRVSELVHVDARVNENTHATSVVAARLEAVVREQRLLARLLTLPPSREWRGGPQVRHERIDNDQLSRSAVCRQDSFETPAFQEWLRRLGEAPRYHRKLWEFVFICQALRERGALRPGARGLGFGVGTEPLSAYFASQGCDITATDMAPEAAAAAGWTQTNQYAASKETLRSSAICPDDLFDAHVDFRFCDMRAIPTDLTGFDFCWSACALEHLGSLEAGLTFIERSMDTLAPGGVAIHTTELNLSSDTETIAHGPTVLYRRRDLEQFAHRMRERNVEVEPFDFETGDGALDRYVDFPPYLNEPHLRLAIEGYASTSIGIICRKASGQL